MNNGNSFQVTITNIILYPVLSLTRNINNLKQTPNSNQSTPDRPDRPNRYLLEHEIKTRITYLIYHHNHI